MAQTGMLGLCGSGGRCAQAGLVTPGRQGQWSAGSPSKGGLCFLLSV